MNVDPMEILNELSVTAPLELERAALRVTNRKLLARVAELEPQQGDTSDEQTKDD